MYGYTLRVVSRAITAQYYNVTSMIRMFLVNVEDNKAPIARDCQSSTGTHLVHGKSHLFSGAPKYVLVRISQDHR